jgi:WhiB family redox-sensing transcriptional regulator
MNNLDIDHIIERSRPTYFDGAVCKGMDSNLFHPGQGKAQDLKKALAICGGCGVRFECLSYALENNERYGVWGGSSARQRVYWLEHNTTALKAWDELLNPE